MSSRDPIPPLLSRIYGAFLVRTDFSNHRSWESLRASVETPAVEGFLAGVDVVDDPVHSGLSPAELGGLLPEQYDGPYFFFVADHEAVVVADHPILVVPVSYPAPEFAHLNAEPRTEFRVIAAQLWSVENNLSLGNMDWEEFVDAAVDGVYRASEPSGPRFTPRCRPSEPCQG